VTTKQQVIEEFEEMKGRAELGAISRISLERPLTDAEFKKMTTLMERLYGTPQ